MSSTPSDPIDTWHRVLKDRNPAALDTLLAPDAVFHSPVVHTPQAGRAITKAYLAAALQVLGNESFRYVREVRQGQHAVLEFEVALDGVHVNGVDLIHWNDQGQITDFKVMVRPLKAVNMLHQTMAAMLQAKSPDA